MVLLYPGLNLSVSFSGSAGLVLSCKSPSQREPGLLPGLLLWGGFLRATVSVAAPPVETATEVAA